MNNIINFNNTQQHADNLAFRNRGYDGADFDTKAKSLYVFSNNDIREPVMLLLEQTTIVY